MNFKEEIKSGVVLVDFYADWCGPCKMLAPIIEELKTEIADVKFLKVNVDEERDLALEYSVMSIPTLIIFKDGNLVEKQVGFTSKEDLVNWINSKKS